MTKKWGGPVPPGPPGFDATGKDGVGVSILNGTNWERREDLEYEKVEAILLEFRSSHPNSFV